MKGALVARLQLAINVTDLDSAVERYARILGVEPHKRRSGYANFAVDDPPLKLVLFEGGEPGTINHLGVEVDSTEEVVAATRRFGEAGLDPRVEEGMVCCHALQDKVWTTAPDGVSWEVYTILDDAPDERLAVVGAANGACCSGGAADCC
jgi:catechol 2,3-dioxygenase-like lactoylglutathione lyase family enzyme